MKILVAKLLENNRKETQKSILSIIVSFFIHLKNDILNLFNNSYIEKELVNIFIN